MKRKPKTSSYKPRSNISFPAEMVRKLFKTCGISNADGTEDDEVYADDMPELADHHMAMEDEFETDSKEDDE